MRHTTVLRTDDHALVAEGFAALWHGHVDLVGTVGDRRQLLEAALAWRPDVIVVDMAMPADPEDLKQGHASRSAACALTVPRILATMKASEP
jgi:DNA-binding NarL/FixJ family response regulator